MKLNNKYYKDIRQRRRFLKRESMIKSFKILTKLKSLNFLEALNCLSNLRKDTVIIKNRCFISLRAKSISTKRFKLSRIKLKELANNGLLIGFKKYSW